MTNVLISAAGLCGATIIGAILGFFVKELPHKWNDAVLGYCAGIMLAASTLGLIVPAFEQTSLWWLVVIGVMAGALFLNVLDLVTPHLHHITGLDPEEHRNNARLSQVMLFVMAIACLYNSDTRSSFYTWARQMVGCYMLYPGFVIASVFSDLIVVNYVQQRPWSITLMVIFSFLLKLAMLSTVKATVNKWL